MRTPEGRHKAWRKNATLFQNVANTKNTRPPRLGAPVSASRCARLLRRGRPLRYGPRHYMSPQVPWVPFPFCCYTGVRGFESSLSTPSQAVRWRSLHHLPKSRRPLRGFKLGGHAPAVILISVPVFASRCTRLLRRGWRLRLTRTLANAHANAWGLRPYTRTLAVARANVRPNSLTRGAPNSAPNSDLSSGANSGRKHLQNGRDVAYLGCGR